MPIEIDRLSELIQRNATSDIDFTDHSEEIASWASRLTRAELLRVLDYCGLIPEAYPHDSSEEKLDAKAMDCVVAAAMQMLGYEATVYVERSNKADVLASWKSNHSVAMDAKAFRLSRSAKNPKDYKIEALNRWRQDDDATFACLVAPAGGFPSGRSRLYAEAVQYNVALLSFTHLKFAIEHTSRKRINLSQIFDLKSYASIDSRIQPLASEFWAATDKKFCQLIGIGLSSWKRYRHSSLKALIGLADQEIHNLGLLKTNITHMSREELALLAIKSMKLDEKISKIFGSKKNAQDLLKQVESAES